MNNKKFYIFASLIIIVIAGLLLYFKITKKETVPEPTPLTKTVIPTDFSKEKEILTEANTPTTNTINSKLFLELDSSEVFLDLISVDLNQDGMDDQIIAVKKLLDPFLHLIFAIQDPISHKWSRIHDIKTTITEPKSLNFYTMQLSNPIPLLVYSGITSENQQVLSIQKIIKNTNLQFEEVISLNADVKIQIQELQSSEDDELIDFSSFKIYTYDADPNAPNTLNQVKTEYVWDYNTNTYEKGLTTTIPGEKIETKLLKELKKGDKESITEFLNALWFKKINKSSDRNRSFYFDKKENIIIFNRTGIEEIYEIISINSLRYGLYLKTQNKSIPNIIRYVRVEVKGVDEIYIGVRENVRRIKYVTKSLWTGNYKKNLPQSHREVTKRNILKDLKDALNKSKKEWTNAEQNRLVFDNNKYTLEFFNEKESGMYNILEIKDKTVLQLRNNKKQNTFYLIKLSEKEKIQTITLEKIKLKINEIVEFSKEEITLKREI